MKGKFTVITGPMFSGKTTTLQIEYDKARKVGKPRIYKPSIDDRYSIDEVVTHDGEKREAVNCKNAEELELFSTGGDITDIFIDEAQFFDPMIVGVVQNLLNEGKNVYVACLNQDYRGTPFSLGRPDYNVGELLARADDIKYLKARCETCGEEASKTYRKSQGGSTVELGSGDKYEARCYKHHS